MDSNEISLNAYKNNLQKASVLLAEWGKDQEYKIVQGYLSELLKVSQGKVTSGLLVKLDEHILEKLRRNQVYLDYVPEYLKEFQTQSENSKFPAAEAYIEKIHLDALEKMREMVQSSSKGEIKQA